MVAHFTPTPYCLMAVGGFDGDLVVGLVAIFDAEVVILQLDVEVRRISFFFDELPNDPGHLVAVEVDHRSLNFDLRHKRPLYAARMGRKQLEVPACVGKCGLGFEARKVVHPRPFSQGWRRKAGFRGLSVGLSGFGR